MQGPAGALERARTTLGRPTIAIFSVPGPGSAALGSAAAAPLLSGPGCGWRASAALSTSGCSAPYRSTKPSPAGRTQLVGPAHRPRAAPANFSCAPHLSQLIWLRERPAPGASPPPQSRLRRHKQRLRSGQGHAVASEPHMEQARLAPRCAPTPPLCSQPAARAVGCGRAARQPRRGRWAARRRARPGRAAPRCCAAGRWR